MEVYESEHFSWEIMGDRVWTMWWPKNLGGTTAPPVHFLQVDTVQQMVLHLVEQTSETHNATIVVEALLLQTRHVVVIVGPPSLSKRWVNAMFLMCSGYKKLPFASVALEA